MVLPEKIGTIRQNSSKNNQLDENKLQPLPTINLEWVLQLRLLNTFAQLDLCSTRCNGT